MPNPTPRVSPWPVAARISALLSCSTLLLAAAHAQTAAADLPAGTPLVLRIPDNLPMRAGLPITAELLYPVFCDNKIVLPENTLLNGTVVELQPDSKRRNRARLSGDFTPFHTPVVRFTALTLPDGVHIPIETATATDGAPIYRAVAPPPRKGGFIRREFENGVTVVRSDIAIFTAPGKADRATQFVYNRLPYHPERIEKGTSWTTTTSAPIALPAQPAPPPVIAAALPPKRHFWQEPAPTPPPANTDPNADSGRWILKAYLDQPLSSEVSTTGQPIQATVAEPVLNPDGTVAVPQGATLVGTVAKSKPARRFGRTGVLSFNFRQLNLPNSAPQNVETTLVGADSTPGLALNSEGEVKSKPRDKLSVPIFLALLASRPLDHDRGDNDGGAGRNAAGGAAGLGLVGSIIGAAGISANAAAGIGYYGTALAIYDRWIARGKLVTFPKNTRIVVQTVSRRSAPMHPDPPTNQRPAAPVHR